MITRDDGYYNILNIVPLASGTYTLKLKNEHLIIKTAERDFVFKFAESWESEKWFFHLLQIPGRDINHFIGETNRLKEHPYLDDEMKAYLKVEREISKTLQKLNKLVKEKDSLENKLKDTYKFEEYTKSEVKLQNYNDDII